MIWDKILISLEKLSTIMIKQYISAILRSLGLAKLANKARFYLYIIIKFNKNRKFTKEYPTVALPPNYLMYESFQLDYSKYYLGGRTSALEIIELVRPYIILKSINILDWGCGPARILRHMPSILNNENNYFGCDYNDKTIYWCRSNISNIDFYRNNITPPTDYPDSFFGCIYGISVFTHLSEKNQLEWSMELHRIVSVDGVILVTTHGEAFLEKLTSHERKSFKKNKLISRTNVTEGHRMFGAFQPPSYMRNIFHQANLEVLNHIPGKKVSNSYISQDKWVLKAIK